MKKLIAVAIFLAGAHASAAQRDRFSWLEGTWKLNDRNVYEAWVVNDQKFSGQAYTVTGSDTTVTEMISLEFFDGSFHYIPDIAGPQPPVDFKITTITDHGFVAENPLHDFPKLIRYQCFKRQSTEILEAAIEGDGKIITYSFKKIK